MTSIPGERPSRKRDRDKAQRFAPYTALCWTSGHKSSTFNKSHTIRLLAGVQVLPIDVAGIWPYRLRAVVNVRCSLETIPLPLPRPGQDNGDMSDEKARFRRRMDVYFGLGFLAALLIFVLNWFTTGEPFLLISVVGPVMIIGFWLWVRPATHY